MRFAILAVLAATACASSSAHGPVVPKAPNDELILGAYERHKPDGETAIRFETGAGYRIAKAKGDLDAEPPLAKGTWQLDKDQLTLTATAGQCADKPALKTGVYQVVISKIGIHWKKIDDACEHRHFDGQTWWRVR
jgi:hypothetical protein